MSETFSSTAIAVLIYVSIGWCISAWLTRADIVDPFWGPGFALIAIVSSWVSMTYKQTISIATVLLLAATIAWGLRLGIHLSIRWWGEEHEDRRYAAMRSDGSRHWWLRSLFTVFWLQGLIMWIVALPLQFALRQPTVQIEPIFLLGFAIWLVGFLFETIGDWQLTRFRSNPDNSNKVLNTGLWRFTRHPNYFGDFTVWWGLFLMSVHCGAPLWTSIGPIIMSAFLMKFSGVGMLEKDITSRRPGYEQYVRQTNTFWPWPPNTNQTQ